MARKARATEGRTEIERDRLRILWNNNWYDGPLEGVCEIGEQICYFKAAIEDEDDPFPRCCVVWRLTDEQVAEERWWHELFVELVVKHPDYGKPIPAFDWTPDAPDWGGYYSAQATRKPIELADVDVIGYCWL